MSRIKPLDPGALPEEVKPILDYARQTMGFTPNDVLIMARWPELLQATLPLVGTIFVPGAVDMELKRLVALIVSTAAGCQYCMAHNAHGLEQDGIDADKLAAVWEFETHAAFTDRERAALRFARGAGQSPAAVTPEEFADLESHFSEQEILEIGGVIALFGFLNRWNASFAVTLEAEPLRAAAEHLAGGGWVPGIHRPDGG